MQGKAFAALTTALFGAVTYISTASVVPTTALAAEPLLCTELDGPAGGLAGNPLIKSATSTKINASGPNVAYCQVQLLWGRTAQENINITVGLPLNSRDGGSGGVQGAWNGRTQGVGGGGCAGALNQPPSPPYPAPGPPGTLNGAGLAAVNTGYVGSGTDLGHAGGDCTPGVNPDQTYNFTFIDDFIRVAIKQQVLRSKSLATVYYGMNPAYNYWNGCSTGGRQGYLLAQELGDQLEGILADAPAMYWTRFQTAQMWGQIVMKDMTGGPIDPKKLTYATNAAVAACDGQDGVIDGIIDDPRTCTFSANTPALICTANGGTSNDQNCLKPVEAKAIDKLWDGPRNAKGNKIWFALDRGTNLGTGFSLDGTPPFPLGVTQFQWDEHNQNFDWTTVGMAVYAKIAQDGSTNPVIPGVSLADETDTFGDLDKFKKHGGKLLTFVGGNDQLIFPRGVINYYRQMAARYSNSNQPNFKALYDFYRLFRAPGVGHCGGGFTPDGSLAPQPQNLFGSLVNWVEHGQAPDQIPTAGGKVNRPLCLYPKTALSNGAGGFQCGGNLETVTTVCADVLVKYKHEDSSEQLDYSGTGVNRQICDQAGNSANAKP